jgi:hypothetical protein
LLLGPLDDGNGRIRPELVPLADSLLAFHVLQPRRAAAHLRELIAA